MDNIAITRSIYEAVVAGDLDHVFAHLHPDIVIRYYGVDDIPYAGVYEGLDGATAFFTHVGTSAEVVAMDPQEFISEGENLAVIGHLHFRRVDTGQEFESEFAHIITLRDGKWLHFRDFINTAVAADVFRS